MQIPQVLLKPIARMAGKAANMQLKNFLLAHKKTAELQDRLLKQLLAAHGDTDFGRDHNLKSVTSYEDFTRAVPVQSYQTLKPYIDKVLGGQRTALIPPDDDVLMFSMTSGTTGEPKHIPVTRRSVTDIRKGWNVFGIRLYRDHPKAWLRHILQISSSMDESRSPSGKPCGAVSGLLAAEQKRIVRRLYTTPISVSQITDPPSKYYTILRCGVGKDVGMITTANPSSTIKLIETGQEHTEQLIRDVADGTLNPPSQIDPQITRQLRLKPDPALAAKLQAGVDRDGTLLPKHFWSVTVLGNWTGGTMSLYIPRLRELFEGAAIRDIGLLASEGRFSIPLSDSTPAGVAEILGNFLEFIPADQAEDQNPPTLRAHELELSKEYVLVISNWTSLLRYNMDDHVRVVDRFGQSPVFEFLSRGRHTASITGEKITEHQVVESMRLASASAGASVERFILQGKFAQTPYYQLSLEWPDSESANRLADLMDEALSKLNIEYHSKRSTGRLGPIRPVLLDAGVLDKTEANNIRLRKGRTEQYKHQYLLTNVLTDEAAAGAGDS